MEYLSKLRSQYWYITINWTPEFLQTSLVFTLMSFFLFQVSVQDITWHLIIMHSWSPLVCDSFLIFPFFFFILKVLRSTGQMFCKMQLNLDLSDVFLKLRQGIWVLEKNTTQGKCLSILYVTIIYVTILYKGVYDINVESLVILILITSLRWCLTDSSN